MKKALEAGLENELTVMKNKIMAFRDARDWRQYHNPKSLSQAIGIEAAELQEIFLWLTTEQSHRLNDADIDRVGDELADIFIFMMYLCDAFQIDLTHAVALKLEKNAVKYPVVKSKGLSTKYTEL